MTWKKITFLHLFGLLVLAGACKDEVDPSMFEIYTGPISTGYDVNLYHSDSAIVRIHLQAKKQLEFDTGDQEFPEGIDITFFDENGTITTTIRADKGFYMRNDNLYRGEGDVQVKNLEKEQSLSSEEMFWDPNAQKIYTEKFVTVTDKKTIIKGTGLEADEGFNEYKIFKPFDSRMIIPGEN
ncbi:LPS export ABC transporter periplasmic protein LptC [Mongoliitalea daihaiensis]|uniref:LPS export ABC transporter periplasmic protein LptC n=1 Tax=Mongoliitalea daihaiensis TaxID=2782006 RepID=UPI001F479051|nr:LPS export ABC transporter periplasmic protein LptC [Mongoliitalea daihaiensis]UJP66379.1 LPS export ABC transporter periplasmic protein LptC [Mongoliitalea daihaiensis]